MPMPGSSLRDVRLSARAKKNAMATCNSERTTRSGPGLLFALSWLLLAGCASPPPYDVVIRKGTIYDGSGDVPIVADIAIRSDRIAAIGALGSARGRTEIDAHGLAVAPGFVNMMTGEETLFADGRSQSEIRQGVTLEVMGEGESMGPLTPEMRTYFEKRQGDIKYPMPWSTLREGLDTLARHGVSCNIASFVG